MNGLEGEGEGDGGGESGRGGDGPTPSVTQLLPRGRSQRPLKAPLERAQARQDPRLHCTHRGASRGLVVKPGAALPPHWTQPGLAPQERPPGGWRVSRATIPPSLLHQQDSF